MASDRKDSNSEEELTGLQGCMAGADEQWRGFCKFIWNPTDRTVMGRGGKSWGQILIFYAIYYSFLAALFAIAISIVLGTLDPYRPRFQTRVQTPGMSIQPRLESWQDASSDIFYTSGDNDSSVRYVSQLKYFLDGYGPQTDEGLYETCKNGKILKSQTFEDGQIATACRFYPNQLGPCATFPYGYDKDQPCILVKLNRIINWYPVGFTNLTKATYDNHISHAPPLQEVLNVNKIKYNPYYVYVSCYGMKPEDQQNLNGETGVSANTKYYPQENGIPFMYFPYYGNVRQPQYKSPVVAVQFTNVKKDVLIKVGCKAYAANIIDDLRMQVGYYTFEMKINS